MNVDIAVENTVLRRKLADYERILKEREIDPLTQLYSRQKFFSEVRATLDANPNKHFIFMRFDVD